MDNETILQYAEDAYPYSKGAYAYNDRQETLRNVFIAGAKLYVAQPKEKDERIAHYEAALLKISTENYDAKPGWSAADCIDDLKAIAANAIYEAHHGLIDNTLTAPSATDGE